MDTDTKEKILSSLYKEMTKHDFPDEQEVDYVFDESTGTYYCLTGKKQMPRSDLEMAKKYFEETFKRMSKEKDSYQKSLYVSVAIECIAAQLNEKIKKQTK